MSSFNDAAAEHIERTRRLRRVPFELRIPPGTFQLRRGVDRFPYVPSDPRDLGQRCYEAYNIQVHGLMKRLTSTGIEKIVIGVSGGLDSTQALIVAARTMDQLGLPRTNILAYSLPGFATGERTRSNAHKLMRALKVTANEIDIRPSALQMLRDIDHPFARGEPLHDITFENVQAGERTSHLFRLANKYAALVLGTGDLSELALGWTTYGVGDHMSHYHVNASIPKTLIQFLIRWVIASNQFDAETNQILRSIVETKISPELVPARTHDSAAEGNAPESTPTDEQTAGSPDAEGEVQSTEGVIGPLELQDFHLYYITRFGYRPSKVAYLAYNAWADRERGTWPELVPPEKRHEYDLPSIKKWLGVFLHRFFKESQFKRSAIPNAPKVGSGGSLSPRGDWRAPSDSEATVWLDELEQNVPASREDTTTITR